MEAEIIDQTIEDFVGRYYLPKVLEGICSLEERDLDRVADMITQRINNERAIYVFGNGGSEAIADQMCYALEIKIDEGSQCYIQSNPKPSLSLDKEHELLFERQIKRAHPRDLVILVSGSGNSENILYAYELCKKRGIESISVSRGGRLQELENYRASHSVKIPIMDQQIEEDVALGFLLLAADLAGYKLEKNKYQDAEGIKEDAYVAVAREVEKVEASYLCQISKKIVEAYANGNNVRIDAPESGPLLITAQHLVHNLKWDAFQDIEDVPSNQAHSDCLPYHASGVRNDGGEKYNVSLEVKYNNRPKDVELIFARDLFDNRFNALYYQCLENGIDPFVLNVSDIAEPSFRSDESLGYIVASQSLAHIIGRIVNGLLQLDSRGADECILQEHLGKSLERLPRAADLSEDLMMRYESIE
jgi:D-sedoheptulose 7-phosphate isomerase